MFGSHDPCYRILRDIFKSHTIMWMRNSWYPFLVPVVDTQSSLAPSTQSDGPTSFSNNKCDGGKFTHDYSRFTHDFSVLFRSFTYLLGPYDVLFEVLLTISHDFRFVLILQKLHTSQCGATMHACMHTLVFFGRCI